MVKHSLKHSTSKLGTAKILASAIVSEILFGW